MGEVRLEAGDREGARDAFGQVVGILERLREQNIWTHASLANAAFVLGQDGRAIDQLQTIRREQPDADSIAIVERGLRKLADSVENGPQRVPRLLDALRP